jgi:hypothetical protein
MSAIWNDYSTLPLLKSNRTFRYFFTFTDTKRNKFSEILIPLPEFSTTKTSVDFSCCLTNLSYFNFRTIYQHNIKKHKASITIKYSSFDVNRSLKFHIFNLRLPVNEISFSIHHFGFEYPAVNFLFTSAPFVRTVIFEKEHRAVPIFLVSHYD